MGDILALMQAHVASFKKPTREEYFQQIIERDKNEPVLPLLSKPCGDCAVTCGFYGEITQALATQPQNVQLEVSQKWFCHNHNGRACRGNANELGITW